MNEDARAGLKQLLSDVTSAHRLYEQTDLGGSTDSDWSHWYADWLLGAGIQELLGSAVTADQLSRALEDGFPHYAAVAAERSWAEFMADRLLKQGTGPGAEESDTG